jgi:hypothetical protein
MTVGQVSTREIKSDLHYFTIISLAIVLPIRASIGGRFILAVGHLLLGDCDKGDKNQQGTGKKAPTAKNQVKQQLELA